MQHLQVILIAFPVFLGLILLEAYGYKRLKKTFPAKEALVSLFILVIYQLVNYGGSQLLAPFTLYMYNLRLWTVPLDSWWGMVGLFLAVEFAYYWLHRCAHEIRWLWASHNVHHSPTEVTLSGAYRLSITGILSGLFLFFVPLYILGFEPKAVALMFGLNLVYQFWLHTELIPRLGFLEGIINTPSNHRVHHSIEPAYLDKNYGGVLMIFDRLFGTYAAEVQGQPKAYGILGRKPTLNPLKLFFQEWIDILKDVKKASTIKAVFYCCMGAPGWQESHKNERQVGDLTLESTQ